MSLTDSDYAKVLAWAYAETKDFARAEALLQDDAPWRRAMRKKQAAEGEEPDTPQRDSWEELLLLRIMVAANDTTRAHQLGAKIVEPLELVGGSNFSPLVSPMLMHYNGAVALKAEYEQAVQWLKNEFPEKKDAIDLPYGTHVGPREPVEANPFELVPASRRISDLRLGWRKQSMPRQRGTFATSWPWHARTQASTPRRPTSSRQMPSSLPRPMGLPRRR